MSLGPFVVLTEDGARDAREVIMALVKRTLTQVVAPGCDTRALFAFDEAMDDAVNRLRPLLVGANWKDRRISLLQLNQFIATQLVQGRTVVHHIDGDQPWSQAPGENAEKYDRRVRSAVRALLRGKQLAEADVEAHLARLVLWMPYYSIEAWLYQNFDEVERIAQGDASLLALVAEWRARPTVLEEVVKPKELHRKLGIQHNLRLAKASWPAKEVFARGLSYAVGAAQFMGVGGYAEP